MKTNVQQSSIDCFYGRVQSDKGKQQVRILSAMAPGRDYTGRELGALTGLTPNVISARLFELREEFKLVQRLPKRRVCSVSNVNVFAHKLAPEQRELPL